MGLPPRTQPTGTQPAGSQSTTADDSFRAIPLSASPILRGGEGGPAGIVFNGSSLDAAIDESLSCCGKYSLRNTHHKSVAGITSDGCMIFAVNCVIASRNYTAMGAFDSFGKPIPLTMTQKDLLGRYVPDVQKLMIPDIKKDPTVFGFKSTTNPSLGIYIDPAKKQYVFHFNGDIEDPNIKTHVSANFARDGKFAGAGADFAIANDKWTLKGGAKVNEEFKTVNRSADLSYASGKWEAGLGYDKSGKETTRYARVSYKPSPMFKLTISALPDNKPISPSPTFDFSKPPSFHDASTIQFKAELFFPLRK